MKQVAMAVHPMGAMQADNLGCPALSRHPPSDLRQYRTGSNFKIKATSGSQNQP